MSHHGNDVKVQQTTSKEWLKVGAKIGELVNTWAVREDLSVYVGSWVGEGHGAPAAFNPKTAEIEVNTDIAFDRADPNLIGDFTERTVQLEYPKASGAILHEGLHARYSRWDLEGTYELLKDEPHTWDTLNLLEEIRIESRGVEAFPENVLYLRASAMGIIMSDINNTDPDQQFKVRQSARVAALVLGRLDVGVLQDRDVMNVADLIRRTLSDQFVSALGRIWREFAGLKHTQIDRMIELSRQWELLMRTEQQAQGEPEDSVMSMGELADMLGALGDDEFSVSISISREAGEEIQREEYRGEAIRSNDRAQDRSKARDIANKIFKNTGPASAVGRYKTSSDLIVSRPPTSAERQSAVTLARALERAKYRDRAKTDVSSVIPPGRLRTRVMIQGLAQKSKGVVSTVEPWSQVKRRHVDDPPLTIGVMVDISGSMDTAMKPMASTAWILSEAARRVQGRVAVVYYGSSVFSTLKPGQHLDDVQVYTAPDSTEEFDDAFLALDGGLNLIDGTGARLLVVVSDGQYRADMKPKVVPRIRQAIASGVGVLWIGAGAYGSHMAEAYCRDSAAEFLPLGTASVTGVIDKLAALATKAITTVGSAR